MVSKLFTIVNKKTGHNVPFFLFTKFSMQFLLTELPHKPVIIFIELVLKNAVVFFAELFFRSRVDDITDHVKPFSSETDHNIQHR